MTRARLAAPGVSFAIITLLVAVPLVLGHRVLRDVLVSFHWSLAYAFGELGPWLLLLAGVGFLVPVAVSAGRNPESRLYPRARRVYFIWGVILYLLGAVLTVELYDLWAYAH